MHTVIMPAYNAARYIGPAIESVLSQTVRDLELLIIDDGSQDATLKIARGYAEYDKRIRVVAQQNAGIAHTLNRALEMVNSEWVFLMHADDLMVSTRLERQSAFIAEHPDLAVASSLVMYINGDDGVIGHGRSPFTDPNTVAEAARLGQLIAFSHPACALRRKAILDVGGYRQAFWPAEDCDLWSRLAEAGHRLLVQDECLLKYRIHGSAASISKARFNQQKTIWLEHCIASRLHGEPEPTWEEFQLQRQHCAWPTRFNHSRQELGRTFYQQALHHVSTGSYFKLVPMLAAAAALQPGMVLSRVLPRLLPHHGKAA
jgi:glycosyltransferase involved in cell wall biosynthesis